MARYRPDPAILELGPDFYDPVEPARFPQCTSRFVNARWADRVGLELDEARWAAHFCRFEPLPDNLGQPLALRSHGPQFRVYNPAPIQTNRGAVAGCSTWVPRARARRPTAATPTDA